MANRRLKLLGHPVLEEYDRSLYFDACYGLRRNPLPFMDLALSQAPIAIPQHPIRSCVYQELEACASMGKIQPTEAADWHKHLLAHGVPRDLGLTQNGIIALDRRDAAGTDLLASVYAALQRGPERDQLHLQALAWAQESQINVVPRAWLVASGLFLRFPHVHETEGRERAFLRLLADTYHTPLGAFLEATQSAYRLASNALRIGKGNGDR